VPRDHDLRQETDEPAAHEILDRFVDAGGTFIDTADVYSAGVSEEIIGRWLKRRGRHDDLVIATKARFPVGDGAPSGLSRRYLRRAVEANLRRLGVERIDLHQAHCWDPNTPIEETLDTYEDLVREGKIDYVGVSNFAGWHLQRTMLLGRERPRALPVTVQPQYSLLQRGLEWEVGPVCAQEDVGILPWSPLGGGWLAGKYRRGERPRAPRAWARTPPAARRRGTGAARSRPGRCSTWSGRSPRPAASR
jgi:aryl-alcohol dehydrogenase-like predicted oxidoreductase